MEHIAIILILIIAAYFIGRTIGKAAKSLEKTRLVIVETNNLNQQIIDRLENMTNELRGMAIK
jgi:uncharacterized protein (UPF0333 family)